VARADDAAAGGDTAASGGATATGPATDQAKAGQGRTWNDAPLDLPGDAETTQERVAALEHELHVSLATYDGALGAEQRRAKGGEGGLADVSKDESKADKTASSSAPSDGGTSTSSGGNGRAGRESGSSTAGTQTNGAGGGAGGASKAPGGTNSTAVPEDIPSGQDDDVVARQIREAAMNEPDPVLRDKLWQEYRDYKASISGGGSTEPKAEPASATEQAKE